MLQHARPRYLGRRALVTSRSLILYDSSFVLFIVAELLLMLPAHKGGYPAPWQTVFGFVLGALYAGFTVYQGFVVQQMTSPWRGRSSAQGTRYGRSAMLMACLYLLIIALMCFMTFLVTSPLRNTPFP